MVKPERSNALELDDSSLAGVSGGRFVAEQNGRYYRYEGAGPSEDWSGCYLCPNCGHPLSWGIWQRYHCDVCDESWYWEDKLVVNTANSAWREITKETYEAATGRG